MYNNSVAANNSRKNDKGLGGNYSKRFNQDVPCKTALQAEAGHPAKRPRMEMTSTSVADDVWGDDFDESTLDECFFLASQVLSQQSTTEAIKKEDVPSAQRSNQQPQSSKQKQCPVFVGNKPSTSRQTDSFPERSNFFSKVDKNVSTVTKQTEYLQRSNMLNSGISKKSISPFSKQVEMVSQNYVSVNAKMITTSEATAVSVNASSSCTYKNSVTDDEKNSLIRELQQLRMANKKLQDQILTKDGEVSILRIQLNSTKAEIETQRLTRARELEMQALDYKEKMKELDKELTQTKTLLEFKSLEVGNAQDRCRLLESQSKVKLVEPQISQTPVKFPRNLPGKNNNLESSTLHQKTEDRRISDVTNKAIAEEIRHVQVGSVLSDLVTPALFEKSQYGEESISIRDIRELPLLMDEYGVNLTPINVTLNITHTAMSKLLLKKSLTTENSHCLIKKIVWQCHVMFMKQRNYMLRHRVPRSTEKLKQIDVKVSEAAGKFVGGNCNVMTARPWYTNEQGVEVRRALGLLAALAMVSKFAAQYMLGIIQLVEFTPRRLIKARLHQINDNKIKLVTPVKSCASRLKPLKMTKEVNEQVTKRVLANLAICRARNCIREAKRKEAEKQNAELCDVKQEPDNVEILKNSTSSSSRGNLLWYRKHMEKHNAAVQEKVKLKRPSRLHRKPPPYSASTEIMKMPQKNNKQSAVSKKDNSSKNSLPGTSKENSSSGTYIRCEKSADKEMAEDEKNRFAQPETDKDLASSDDHLFKKPLPVKKSSLKHKTLINSLRQPERNRLEGGKTEQNSIKREMRHYWVDMKTLEMGLASRRQRFIHPAVLGCQKIRAKNFRKLPKKTQILHDKRLQLLQKKQRTLQLKKTQHVKETADLMRTLYSLIRFICTHRLSVHFNGVVFGVVHLLKSISHKVRFRTNRLTLLSDIIKFVLLSRPCINVLMELTDLLYSLPTYHTLLQSLCAGIGPSPYIGGNMGIVYFVAGKPRYDVGCMSDLECFTKDSCVISLLCYLLLLQRAGISQYVVLGNSLIQWLGCVSSQDELAPHWIGSNEHTGEIRECQCRARIIEATIILLHISYEHIKSTNFHKDKLFYDIRRLLGGGLIFLHKLVHQDSDVGLLMANAEGEYQVLVHGLRDNLHFMDFSEEEEEALNVLNVLEDYHEENHQILTCSNAANEIKNDTFEDIVSFCGPSYK